MAGIELVVKMLVNKLGWAPVMVGEQKAVAAASL